MKKAEGISLSNVQDVYSGPEGTLWELIMGEQIHIGGFQSSLELAEKAGIKPGMHGADLCCCNGGGVRFLLRFRGAESMTGVDATGKVLAQAETRCAEQGLAGKARFVKADVTSTGLPPESFDFVWGEDAWCYVENKEALISEAARIVKPGGIIAFTDWIEGPEPLTDQEAARLLSFMKFPSINDLQGYCCALKASGFTVTAAEYTSRFAPYCDLYIKMLTMQLTTDALRIIGFNSELLSGLGTEMQFMKELADAGKIEQGLFTARKAP